MPSARETPLCREFPRCVEQGPEPTSEVVGGASEPRLRSLATAPVRFETPSFPNACSRCFATVRSLTAADVRIGWRQPNERAAI